MIVPTAPRNQCQAVEYDKSADALGTGNATAG